MNRNPLKRLLQTTRRPHRLRRRPGNQTHAEILEDRTLLATINVTTFDDVVAADGEVSLREAITQANGSAAADEIILPAGTYTLTLTGTPEDNNVSGDLDLLTDIVIRGAGAGDTIIDAGGDSGIGERVIHALGDGTVTIEDVTIRGGRDGGGAGILNRSVLTVIDSTISGNQVNFVGGGGGGIMNLRSAARARIISSTISENSASHGGGIWSLNASLVVVNSTISGNTATDSGGAILSFSDGVDNSAEALILQSTITGNHQQTRGGAVNSGFQNGSTSAVLQICNSILVRNTGAEGNLWQSDPGVISLGHNLSDDDANGRSRSRVV